MTARTIVQALANAIAARENCTRVGNTEWYEKHSAYIDELIDELPSGSGWDNGTKIDLEKSTETRIVLYGGFHHTDAHGGYDNWTDHVITVRPSFVHGMDLTISGRDRNEIKDYLAEMFSYALGCPAPIPSYAPVATETLALEDARKDNDNE